MKWCGKLTAGPSIESAHVTLPPILDYEVEDEFDGITAQRRQFSGDLGAATLTLNYLPPSEESLSNFLKSLVFVEVLVCAVKPNQTFLSWLMYQ